MRPETLTLDRIATPLGTVLVVTDDTEAVCAFDFEDYERRMRRLLAKHHPRAVLVDGPVPKAVKAAIIAYFAGDMQALDELAVRTGGTDFQREVWAALRAIPPGETRSYGQLALAVGRLRAMRAVGLANGSNPIGVIVPCHRVIGADGSLTGYAGGIERKKWLLVHEGCTA